MEEFISENIRFNGRKPKMSIIGEQEKPVVEDIGSSGEPIGDLLALINNELFQTGPRIVFVVDGIRPHQYSERLKNQDIEALAAAWTINPVFDDAVEEKEIPTLFDEEEDLEDLPFDTGAVR